MWMEMEEVKSEVKSAFQDGLGIVAASVLSQAD
jgi:hypothetical protein